MLHEHLENTNEEMFSIGNSMTSVTSRPIFNQNNLNNNNNNEIISENLGFRDSKLSKFSNFIDSSIYQITLMIIIIFNMSTSLVGLYYHGDCRGKLKFIPNYLIAFGIISIILIEIYIFFPKNKTSEKFDFYFKYTLMEIKKMSAEDQNRIKEAIVPLKIQKKKMDDFNRIQKTLVNVLRKILEAGLALLILDTFIKFSSIVGKFESEDSTKDNYCYKHFYNFSFCHLVFICGSLISFVLVSVFYLTGYFLFFNNKS